MVLPISSVSILDDVSEVSSPSETFYGLLQVPGVREGTRLDLRRTDRDSTLSLSTQSWCHEPFYGRFSDPWGVVNRRTRLRVDGPGMSGNRRRVQVPTHDPTRCLSPKYFENDSRVQSPVFFYLRGSLLSFRCETSVPGSVKGLCDRVGRKYRRTVSPTPEKV